jgi:nucleotide-binding universal stress UspA family protein
MNQVLLVGVDCSNCSDRAVGYAANLAKSGGARVLVVHVIEWSPYTFNTPTENEQRHKRREEEIGRAQAEIIDPVVALLSEQGIDASGLVRHGHAAETLKRVADEQEVNSIIVGRTGTSRIKAQLFGSVAGTLVQISNQPVIVVP